MAFLQRVINGGGTVSREYALGSRRIDLFVRWKNQTFVIELKIKHDQNTLKEGCIQTSNYLDLCNADEGHLLIFDRNPKKTWEEKISSEIIEFNQKKIYVWTM